MSSFELGEDGAELGLGPGLGSAQQVDDEAGEQEGSQDVLASWVRRVQNCMAPTPPLIP